MVIHSSGLLLRPLAESDAFSLLEIISDETVQNMTVGFPPEPTIDTARTIILTRQNWEKSGTGWQLGIEYEGELAGLVGINALNRTCDRASLDYVIAPHFRGRGFASAAVQAFIPHAVKSFSLHRISASCFADNIPSQKVLEKCGFALEGVFRDEIKKNGIYRDAAHYGLIVQE